MRFSFNKGKILVLIIIVIALVLSLNFFQKKVKGFFYDFSAPLQKSLWAAGNRVSGFFRTMGDSSGLKAENDELKLTIQGLLAENASLKELEKENEALRDALQIGLQKDFQLALAEVIGKDIGQESILVNQGARDGLSLGMPVITQQKILLGRISEVYDNFSRIMLISNKESSFDAKISGSDITGVAKGAGHVRIEFGLIPREKNLQIDDLVISSSLGGVYPGGLLVGQIKQIARDDVSPFYQAEIAPFFDISAMEAVFIILNFTHD